MMEFQFDLNIFYSGIEYTEKDWVRLKVRHYPFQKDVQKHKTQKITFTHTFTLAGSIYINIHNSMD